MKLVYELQLKAMLELESVQEVLLATARYCEDRAEALQPPAKDLTQAFRAAANRIRKTAVRLPSVPGLGSLSSQ